MAGAHDAPDGTQRLGRAHDALADDRVLADEAPFGLVERAGLVQDGVRDGDLADVVQLGRADHDVEVFGVEAQARADRAGQLGDVVHVALQVGLALAEHGEQHLAGLALGRAAAVLEGVHAVVGQTQRVGGGLGVARERDEAERGVDREGAARLCEGGQRRLDDRVVARGVVVEENAELVPAQAIGATLARDSGGEVGAEAL